MHFLHSQVPEAFRQRKKSVSLPILSSIDTGGVQDPCQSCPPLPFWFYKTLYVHNFLPNLLYCAMHFFFSVKIPTLELEEKAVRRFNIYPHSNVTACSGGCQVLQTLPNIWQGCGAAAFDGELS